MRFLHVSFLLEEDSDQNYNRNFDESCRQFFYFMNNNEKPNS